MLLLQPREALLKYAEKADKDPQWTAGGSLFFSCYGGKVADGCPYRVVWLFHVNFLVATITSAAFCTVLARTQPGK